MTVTYDSIATTTLTSNSNTLSFTGIPATFTDLRIVLVHRLATSDGFLDLTFNGNTATNYSETYMWADNSSVQATTSNNRTRIRDVFNSFMNWNTFTEIDIFSYASANNKSLLVKTFAEDNLADTYRAVITGVAMWRNTAAISSLTFTGINSQIASGTIATLYGIKSE